MGIDSIRLNSVVRQPLPPAAGNHSKNFSAAKTSADQSKETNISNGHVAGRDDATKAKLDSAKDKAKSDLDSMSEMGEMESLRLQMSMDRMSQMMSTLSNVMKKVSDTGAAITANLK